MAIPSNRPVRPKVKQTIVTFATLLIAALNEALRDVSARIRPFDDVLLRISGARINAAVRSRGRCTAAGYERNKQHENGSHGRLPYHFVRDSVAPEHLP